MGIRVLQVHPGLVPPPRDPTRSEYYYTGGDICGDILQPTWAPTEQELRDSVGSYPTCQVNNFTYHMGLSGSHPYGTWRQKLHVFRFHMGTALRLGRQYKYDVVKSYGAGLTGFTSWVLAKLLRAKLIIELPGAPEDAYKYAQFGDSYKYSEKLSLKTRMAKVGADLILRIVVGSADRVQLLYPWQLHAYPRLEKVPATVIHIFSSVSKVPEGQPEDGSVLLVGAPWYVKGVDIVIRAWRKIEHEFPNNKLKLMGYFPEEEMLRQMCGDSKQIEFLKARPNPETLQLMARCSIFVLASRTEGTPRVFREAMAAGRPVVGSRVGGVAMCIRDGVNGFLFESENSDELAEKLGILLASPELRAKFGAAGRQIARYETNEVEFGRLMQQMLEETVCGSRSQPEQTAKSEAVAAE